MAEEEGVLTNLDTTGSAGPQPNGADTSPAVGIITQYVKDLSVENPAAPDVYQWPEPPQIGEHRGLVHGGDHLAGRDGQVGEPPPSGAHADGLGHGIQREAGHPSAL